MRITTDEHCVKKENSSSSNQNQVENSRTNSYITQDYIASSTDDQFDEYIRESRVGFE